MKPAWHRAPLEPALSPSLAIIDPHHHFWGDGGFSDSFGRFLPDDVAAMIQQSGHRIVATVYVECFWRYRTEGPEHLRCVGETESVDAVAQAYEGRGGSTPRLAAGIISYADLLLGDSVGEVLDAHMRASPSRFRGIRHIVAADADEPYAGDARRGATRDPKFSAGLAQVERRGLVFETWCLHTQFSEFLALADAFPNLTMVLDHLVTPLRIGRFQGREEEVFRLWTAGIREVGRRPNVVLKLGGLGMPSAGMGWHGAETPPSSAAIAAAYEPYVSVALDAFSTERCIFESNFAVDGAAYGYGAIWNAFKLMTSGLSASEQNALFRDNAAKVYRIEL